MTTPNLALDLPTVGADSDTWGAKLNTAFTAVDTWSALVLAKAGGTLTGALLASVGAVGAPALSFTGDTDTGLYWVSANSFAAACNGAAVLTFAAGGITANGTLAVTGAATFNGAVTLGDAAGDAITVTGTATFGQAIIATGGLTGLASSATILATGRTIALTGDVTYTSGSFNGSANVTGAATLATAQPGAHTWAATQTFTLAPVFTDASGTRTALGVALGSNAQAWDADLDALAALSGTNTIYYRSAANTWTAVTIGAGLTFSAGTLNTSGTGGLLAANNLSELASASTARTNLGLGTSATVNTGTSGAVVPLLNGNNTYGGTAAFSSTVSTGGLLTISAGADLTPATAPSTTSAGYLGSPINTQDATYGLVMSDAGKTIYHTSASTHTWTIPANASVAYPIGTVINFSNENGGGNVTIAITSDTLRSGNATGSRTLAANGNASAQKMTATSWRIIGDSGLT